MHVRNPKAVKLLAAAATSAVTAMGIAAQARADPPFINVLLSQTTDGNTNIGTGTGPNQGVTPTTYTPSLTVIPYAPSATYDSADTDDAGTVWNTLLAPLKAIAQQTSGSTNTVTFQTNLPLTDSFGQSTGIQIGYIAITEPNCKSDGIHNTGVTGLGTGSDGLTANPTQLMSQSWYVNVTSETIIFQLTGMTPNRPLNLYIYGGGANGGNGASFSLPAANQYGGDPFYQSPGYGTGPGWSSTAGLAGTGAYLTVPNDETYHSVFSPSGGNNPQPEQGLTWVVLPAIADANGNLEFFVQEDNASDTRAYINGFQLAFDIPEPATLSLLGAAALGLLSRRRRENYPPTCDDTTT